MPHFEWTVNLGMLVANILLTVVVMYVRKTTKFLRGMSFRVNLMWVQFAKEHPDLAHRYMRKEDIQFAQNYFEND